MWIGNIATCATYLYTAQWVLLRSAGVPGHHASAVVTCAHVQWFRAGFGGQASQVVMEHRVANGVDIWWARNTWRQCRERSVLRRPWLTLLSSMSCFSVFGGGGGGGGACCCFMDSAVWRMKDANQNTLTSPTPATAVAARAGGQGSRRDGAGWLAAAAHTRPSS